jgi:hypothetical protein
MHAEGTRLVAESKHGDTKVHIALRRSMNKQSAEDVVEPRRSATEREPVRVKTEHPGGRGGNGKECVAQWG